MYGGPSNNFIIVVTPLCSLVDEIIAFSHNIGEWLFGALQDLPAALGIRKMQSKSTTVTLMFASNNNFDSILATKK